MGIVESNAKGTTKCIECGDELLAERVDLGYRYCTRKECQARHHRGLAVTSVAVNKSADQIIVADADEIRRRGETGEFGKKDAGLGLDYRGTGARPAPGRVARPRTRRAAPAVPTPVRRTWTAEQERLVRLYNGMGLSPREIVERARQNAPRLGITEPLATKIMCAPPAR
jgi:hypothetical protein